MDCQKSHNSCATKSCRTLLGWYQRLLINAMSRRQHRPDEKTQTLEEPKLHTKDLQEAQTQAETRSPFSSTNQSLSGKLTERNEVQWVQVRQYLVQKHCLPK